MGEHASGGATRPWTANLGNGKEINSQCSGPDCSQAKRRWDGMGWELLRRTGTGDEHWNIHSNLEKSFWKAAIRELRGVHDSQERSTMMMSSSVVELQLREEASFSAADVGRGLS